MDAVNRNATDNSVYLCQVSPNVSCGACCGLYNVADSSPSAIEAMLVRRTKWFADVPRSEAGIDAFQARVVRTEFQKRPFPDFHHCPFLGMIEDTGRRVGCLLHPLAKGNDGLDWRGLSYYGGMACRVYFCPSVRYLPARWLTAVRQSMHHWYLHGLIVTERRLLNAFFLALEDRIGKPIEPFAFTKNACLSKGLRDFAGLKVKWPFRRQYAPGPCNYFFEDCQYPRPMLRSVNGKMTTSPFAAIFRELDSVFASKFELRQAEKRVESVLESIAMAVAN